jgi:hypothetical protein
MTKAIVVRTDVLLSILLSNTFSFCSSLKETTTIHDSLAYILTFSVMEKWAEMTNSFQGK